MPDSNYTLNVNVREDLRGDLARPSLLMDEGTEVLCMGGGCLIQIT